MLYISLYLFVYLFWKDNEYIMNELSAKEIIKLGNILNNNKIMYNTHVANIL